MKTNEKEIYRLDYSDEIKHGDFTVGLKVWIHDPKDRIPFYYDVFEIYLNDECILKLLDHDENIYDLQYQRTDMLTILSFLHLDVAVRKLLQMYDDDIDKRRYYYENKETKEIDLGMLMSTTVYKEAMSDKNKYTEEYSHEVLKYSNISILGQFNTFDTLYYNDKRVSTLEVYYAYNIDDVIYAMYDEKGNLLEGYTRIFNNTWNPLVEYVKDKKDDYLNMIKISPLELLSFEHGCNEILSDIPDTIRNVVIDQLALLGISEETMQKLHKVRFKEILIGNQDDEIDDSTLISETDNLLYRDYPEYKELRIGYNDKEIVTRVKVAGKDEFIYAIPIENREYNTNGFPDTFLTMNDELYMRCPLSTVNTISNYADFKNVFLKEDYLLVDYIGKPIPFGADIPCIYMKAEAPITLKQADNIFDNLDIKKEDIRIIRSLVDFYCEKVLDVVQDLNMSKEQENKNEG